jgi:hypothetical protein
MKMVKELCTKLRINLRNCSASEACHKLECVSNVMLNLNSTYGWLGTWSGLMTKGSVSALLHNSDILMPDVTAVAICFYCVAWPGIWSAHSSVQTSCTLMTRSSTKKKISVSEAMPIIHRHAPVRSKFIDLTLLAALMCIMWMINSNPK